MSTWNKKVKIPTASIFKGQKEDVKKHKTEKVKWNAELSAVWYYLKSLRKNKLLQGAQKKRWKEIKEEDSQKASCSEQVSRSNVSFNWCLPIFIVKILLKLNHITFYRIMYHCRLIRNMTYERWSSWL